MIIILSLSSKAKELYHFEFVKPIEAIVERTGEKYTTYHYSQLRPEEAMRADRIILCGTALGDNEILEKWEEMAWLKEYTGKILGICVGADLLCLIHGGMVNEKKEIGATTIHQTGPDKILGDMDGKEVYELHKLAPSVPPGFELLATSDDCVQAFRAPGYRIYGVLFHPEVRHEEIVERFCS